MLKYKLTIILIILGFFQFSFLGFKTKTPPGTKYCKELGYYIDKSEIDILMWGEFIYYTRKDFGDNKANSFLPDTEIIKKVYGMNIYPPQINYYHYPIVGITSKQIEAYCKFRTDHTKKRTGRIVTYFLYDKSTHAFLKEKFKSKAAGIEYKPYNKVKANKGFRGLFNNAPELIKYQDNYKVLLKKDSLVDLKTNTIPFTFRCIAKY